MTVLDATVKERLCIGCGICASVCPVESITFRYEDGRYQPSIDSNCVNCGVCVDYCWHAKINRNTSMNSGLQFGVEGRIFIARDKREKYSEKSSSGGVVTFIAEKLFEENKIDCVLHAESVFTGIGGEHYKSAISYTYNEMDQRRGSFYGPVCHSQTLQEFKNQQKRVLVIGTPCYISGLKKVFDCHKDFKNNEAMYLALACSHNVTGKFIDYLAFQNDIGEEEFSVNLRSKDGIEDVNNYKNKFITRSGIIKNIDRSESGFTELWRNYYFANKTCLYCHDFWGDAADLSIKDAWGRWAKGRVGKSMVVLKSEDYLPIFVKNGMIEEEITSREAISSQKSTIIYKHLYANRLLNKKGFFLKLFSGYYFYLIGYNKKSHKKMIFRRLLKVRMYVLRIFRKIESKGIKVR